VQRVWFYARTGGGGIGTVEVDADSNDPAPACICVAGNCERRDARVKAKDCCRGVAGGDPARCCTPGVC